MDIRGRKGNVSNRLRSGKRDGRGGYPGNEDRRQNGIGSFTVGERIEHYRKEIEGWRYSETGKEELWQEISDKIDKSTRKIKVKKGRDLGKKKWFNAEWKKRKKLLRKKLRKWRKRKASREEYIRKRRNIRGGMKKKGRGKKRKKRK
ncbi:hypothetical protein RF55_23806 [Lasius niger]|uniref:Uncharacterized protein n=1 Tax=Lasius niger TaxID=67767 RepID=A0A0J7JWE7_LASNI|nr:hypothetical protein RF55_23806 [Lasius niger]